MINNLRKALPPLPRAIQEAILGNVVVGNYTPSNALRVAKIIHDHLERISRSELAIALGSPNA